MRESDGRIKRDARVGTVTTQDAENGRAESWQAGPSSKVLSNADYTRDIHKPTGHSRIEPQPTVVGDRRMSAAAEPCGAVLRRRCSEPHYTLSFVHCSKQCSLFKECVYRHSERIEVMSS